MSVTNKIVVWGSNPNQYDSGNPYQPDANGNEKGFTPGTLNYALYLNKALRNASIVPHALAQMLTHSPVTGNLDINFDINPGDIPTFDANFRSAFDAYVKSTIKVDNATHADTADACTGNSATATKLQTVRTIGGVSFDGSADINLPGVNTIGNQDTTGNAATATIAATANNAISLSANPSILIGSNGNLNKIAIKAGNKTSSYITVPFATKCQQDGTGNIISQTYGHELLVNNATIKLMSSVESDYATELSSITVDNVAHANDLNGFANNFEMKLFNSSGEISYNFDALSTYEIFYTDGTHSPSYICYVGLISIISTNVWIYSPIFTKFTNPAQGQSPSNEYGLCRLVIANGNTIWLETTGTTTSGALSWAKVTSNISGKALHIRKVR